MVPITNFKVRMAQNDSKWYFKISLQEFMSSELELLPKVSKNPVFRTMVGSSGLELGISFLQVS